MIICAVNVNVLLPCLCVLCALLAAGVAAMSVLIAQRNAYNTKIMKRDVYMRENGTLNADFVSSQNNDTIENDCENEKVNDENLSE